jgi:hypothetical protein
MYFTSLVGTAGWGAELATALAGGEERGRIYVVEPLGPFEDDPNVTNKTFPGNPTKSYRTRHPLRVVDEVENWDGHDPEGLRGMLDRFAALRAQGLVGCLGSVSAATSTGLACSYPRSSIHPIRRLCVRQVRRHAR